ncbi:MAG: gamma-glutamylcyclotransferase [Chloroflexi bacterium]|nr:MAG: gamma-glutamylcyclotransferase [Chloroflexota bacterium]
MHPLFVYGTFREGESNRTVIEPFVAGSRPARLPGAVLYYVDPYPMVADGDGSVVGELITLPANSYTEALAALDHFEGYDPATDTGAYRRRLREVIALDTGERVTAWVYLGDPETVEGHPVVPSGDWCRRSFLE